MPSLHCSHLYVLVPDLAESICLWQQLKVSLLLLLLLHNHLLVRVICGRSCYKEAHKKKQQRTKLPLAPCPRSCPLFVSILLSLLMKIACCCLINIFPVDGPSFVEHKIRTTNKISTRQDKRAMRSGSDGGKGKLSSGYAAINFFVINCMSKWAKIFLNFHHLPSLCGNQAWRRLYTRWTVYSTPQQPQAQTLQNHGHHQQNPILASGRARRSGRQVDCTSPSVSALLWRICLPGKWTTLTSLYMM